MRTTRCICPVSSHMHLTGCPKWGRGDPTQAELIIKRQRAEIRLLREMFGRLRNQHECDHPRLACSDIGCFGDEFRALDAKLAALRPAKAKR